MEEKMSLIIDFIEYFRLSWICLDYMLAERAGFEPAVGYEPTHAFQACDLNHSSTSPLLVPFTQLL